jgi:glycosyltransferase involved in cell wall biosynthesis
MRAVGTRLIEHASLRLCTTVLAVSHGVKSCLPHANVAGTVVIENGVDWGAFASESPVEATAALRQKLGVSSDGAVFAMVAHSGPWLDLETVVSAAALVPEVEIVLAGDGEELEKARGTASARGMGNMRFPGVLSHDDIRVLLGGVCLGCLCPYAASWIFSSKPGFFSSRKIKEYMAAGRAVVVSDVPGRGDFLVDGETCLTYPAGSAGALAERIRRVANDPALAQRIGCAARNKAKEFDWSELYARSGLAVRLGMGSRR